MRYRPIPCYVLILVIGIALALPAAGQNSSRSAGASGFRAGLSLGYLTRTLGLNDGELDTTPKMTSLLAGLVLDYEFRPGFTLAALVGYSASDFDSLTFRGLPYSLEIGTDSGKMRGLLVGAGLEMSLLGGSSFGVDLRGDFLASLGFTRKWDIPGLAVEGSANGKPTWMMASAGPVLTYRGWQGLTPFLYPRFDYLWGTFEFEETVQDLEGNEKKDIKSKSLFGLGIGSDLELSSSLRVRGEASLYPREGGMDYSILIQTLFAF
jgi:hypothetical protein